MLGAGIARAGHPTANEMLLMASQKESKAGVTEVWLIRQELKAIEGPFQRENHEKQLRELVEKLYRESPENALSHYLMASLQTPTIGDMAAIKLMNAGNAEHFNGYSRETFQAVVRAAESIGYSPYAACNYALGQLVPVKCMFNTP